MLHLPAFIIDLGVILGAAGAVTILFKWLRQPVVLGYLVAGFLVGPHFPLFPTVVDSESVKVWAEIGVIFLLFGLGLEFSFKKLFAVGRPATITASVEVLFMLGVGYLMGKLFGWGTMDSVFLGGILSISSTTIIIRAFSELGHKGKGFVQLVFGILIVEDLIAILLLVLLSTIAVTKSLAGGALLLAAGKLAFFLAIWFLIGVFLVPILLRKLRPHLNNETTLVFSLALCLAMVILATKAGFSPALGAFVMGSILAETREGSRIEHLISPVRDLFAAVFFVSVGMLINPQVLSGYGPAVLLIALATILGKALSTFLGALLSGRPVRQSVQAGMSLAQIGEFSFIIATLGLTLGVTSDFLYPIAVAVSAITTFTTPYLIRISGRAAALVDSKLPHPLRERLEKYSRAFENQGGSATAVSLLWQSYGPRITTNGILILAVILGAKHILMPELESRFGESLFSSLGAGVLALLISAPFFWGLVLGPPSRHAGLNLAQLERLRLLQPGMLIFRALIGGVLLLLLLGQISSARTVTGFLLAFVLGGITLFSRFAEPLYRMVENRFLHNLDDKERAQASSLQAKPHLAPWNSTLAEFVLSADSELAGKSLEEAKIRESFGVSVAMIERGSKRIPAPRRSDVLLPHDRIYIVGNEDQVLEIQSVIEREPPPPSEESVRFGLVSILLGEESPFSNKAIRDSGLREAVDGLIVGIERNGQRILNPDSTLALQPGDRLWIVGNLSLISAIS